MTPAALHKLVQWLSPAYPIGSFSYSHGLEWVISSGEIPDATALQLWLDDILRHGTGRNDAIFLTQAYRADERALADIAELATAFNTSAERHLETTAQGAAFAKVTRLVWPADLRDMPYPVAVGAAARLHDLPLPETLSLYLHAFLSNLVSASVRFMPLGQTEGQAVLTALIPTIQTVACQALKATLDDLGGCAFRAEMASMQHETLHTRIFRS